MTREEILNLFDYDRERGILIWKNPPEPNRKRLMGKIAGTIDKDGYRVLMFKKKCFKIHRLIWFLENGTWPKIVDHIHGLEKGDMIFNLREVTHRQNTSNTYRHRAGKLVGTFWDKRTKKWVSHIRKDGRQKILGRFFTEFEAHQKYMKELQNVG